ncbi:hypothetical protein SAMN05443574_12035 [Haloarcula vallismortis]|uniref:Uncharacterized protein n=2 Tax=Haloarcula vallismortis TaxID=28442 RepID=M0JLG2_HALVA|nr:hypothetical protein [Haloarcula vallismortis]EMA08834.1 hypothetical protein C437_07752 [Haloarcula vallismortis ATCC 29715]SDX23135.1 hypothetical protein SAMN05443574_12035 [Haloarcula vallismortis]
MTASSGVLSRRRLIALVGGVVTAISGVLYRWLPGVDTGDGDTSNETTGSAGASVQPTATPTGPTAEPNVPRDAESIGGYGSESNLNGPSLAAARRNLQAIRDAAEAAGKGGTIYVPEGEYYFGDEDSGFSPYVEFGEAGPPGVSIFVKRPTN